jgi:hypothetical protein
MTIYFDMDGTIADLYAVENWLADLRAERTRPYAEAKVLVNMSRLARALHKAQRNGAKVGIISWGSKTATTAYDKAVEQTKREWLARHLPSVQFDEIKIVHYGTPKSTLASIGDLLFDDEERNRNEWGNGAYSPEEIFEVLASL